MTFKNIAIVMGTYTLSLICTAIVVAIVLITHNAYSQGCTGTVEERVQVGFVCQLELPKSHVSLCPEGCYLLRPVAVKSLLLELESLDKQVLVFQEAADASDSLRVDLAVLQYERDVALEAAAKVSSGFSLRTLALTGTTAVIVGFVIGLFAL